MLTVDKIDKAIRLLRNGIDGLGCQGDEYEEIADLLAFIKINWAPRDGDN